MHARLKFTPEVQEALGAGRPVLALESTIITHGMPWPRNLETARAVEDAVREAGVVPGTIAVLDGQLRVGLAGEELESLARLGPAAAKCSRRDLPFLAKGGATGATTVAATMNIAHRAGIRVFATGGIGGVHRGAEKTLDISADLQELARTPVAVVCAGPKAILDIGLTLEYLETHGVPVIGFGTDELPAFYTPGSGYLVDYRYDSAAELAEALNLKWELGLEGGVVIANPVPAEHALDRAVVAAWIEAACTEASAQGVSGKGLTPFLLDRLDVLSRGATLETNVQLMLNNARVGAEIAGAFGR